MDTKIKLFAFVVAIVSFSFIIKKKGKAIIDISKRLPTKNGGWPNRSLAGITDITIHHSAGPNNQTAYDFANYHLSKGWPGIGYAFVIDRNGVIYKTSDYNKLSWHNGFNNSKAIGICLVGNFEIVYPTSEQMKSVLFLIDKIKHDFKPGQIRFLNGHKEYDGHTACPGIHFDDEIEFLRNKTGLKNRMKYEPVAKSMAIYAYNQLEADN
jgi:hypothetical protein